MKKMSFPRNRFWLVLIVGVILVFLGWTVNNRAGTSNIGDDAYPNSGTSDTGDSYLCNGKQMTKAQIAEYRNISLETVQLLSLKRGLTVPEICEMPQSKLDRAIFKANTPRPDHPDEAVEFRNLQLQDENGQIPADGLVVAHEQMKTILTQDVGANLAGINRGSWTWLGPGNIGGRVRALVIHPITTTTMWAGSVSGGIWKTTDGGASWQPLDDFMTNVAVSALVIDPANPNTLYAGTGEIFAGDGVRGLGVFKTTDGGTTWTQLSSTNSSNWYYVNRLAISPTGNVILAATASGVWRSTNGGTSWSPTNIVDALDVNFDLTDSNKAIASSRFGQAWYSTDAGASWTPAAFAGISAFANRVEVAYAPGSPAIVYASIDDNSGEIWKSIDGGQTYSQVNTGYNFLGSQGGYDNIIWVDPTNPNTLVVGGIDLWRSTDGGATLTKISEWWNAPLSAHADHHIIIQDPGFNGSTNKKVYFGNDGGVYRADDVYTVVGTTGWTELNNNLGITQFYGAAGNPTTGSIVGGTQDNGTLFYTTATGTEGWTAPYGGDGGFSAYDPADPNYFYGEYVYLNIHRNNSGGASGSENIDGQYWNGSAWVWKNPPYRIDDAMNSTANFIAPFILDPNNANRILGGGNSLWRTNDAKTATTVTTGPAWASIKTSISDPISAIAVAPGNSDIIWVGHNNGNVYKTTNGTNASPTWTQVDTNSPGLPNRYVTRITIDQSDNNKVYVTFGGFSSDNVWVTTNGGTSWADITGTGLAGLPDLPVRSLVINPANSNWLYVGTELGVFASENGGVTWGLPHDGPTNTSVDELFWMNSTLVAATHGRGLFKFSPTSGTTSNIYLPLVLNNYPLSSSLVNGNFESGSGLGWSEFSTHGWPIVRNSGFPGSVTPHGGSWAAWLGGDNSDISYIQQQITISGATPYLAYYHWIDSTDSCGFDFAFVLINGVVVDTYNLCSSQNTGGWVAHSVNLSAYAGQSVMLQIRVETDSTNNSNLFVDDVSFAVTASATNDSEPLTSNPLNSLPKSEALGTR